jgi:hypothetical protein
MIFGFVMAVQGQMLQMGEASEGFVPIFNGKDFGRWEGDEQVWQIEKGRMLGTTDKMTGRQRSLALVYRGDRMKDFELRFEVRLRNNRVKIWMQAEERGERVLQGPSMEISESDKIIKTNEWTEYFVLCKDGKVKVTVNGEVRQEGLEASKFSGLLALEIEAVPAMEVRFRNLRVKKLS